MRPGGAPAEALKRIDEKKKERVARVALAAATESERAERINETAGRATVLRVRGDAPGFERESLADALALHGAAAGMASPPAAVAGALLQTTLSVLARLPLTGHATDVTSASFSADVTRVVTASWDGTARLWNLDPEATLRTGCDLLRGGRIWDALPAVQAACGVTSPQQVSPEAPVVPAPVDAGEAPDDAAPEPSDAGAVHRRHHSSSGRSEH